VSDVLDLIGEQLLRAAQRRVDHSRAHPRLRRATGRLLVPPHDGRRRQRWRSPRVLGAVLLGLIATGSGAYAAAGGFYPANANGQTYGSAAPAPGVPPGPVHEPDLISAIGTALNGNGRVTGYVLRSQLDADTGADVTTPAQAVAWTEAHTGSKATAVSIPLYAQDGTTVIGTFTIAPPGPAPTMTPGTTSP
jgi:hypothetical protein